MVRAAIVALLVILLLVAAAYGAAAVGRTNSRTGAVQSASRTAFSKVVVIVFENKSPRKIFDNPAAPLPRLAESL